MSWFADLLKDPSVKSIDVDGNDRLIVHSKMIAQKPILQEVFTSFHHTFQRLDKYLLSGEGKRVELGAGVAPIRDSYPDVLASDILPGPNLDLVLNAEMMDLPDKSVRVLFGQNCFHHFPHPDLFFKELERVVVVGGGAILLEPYHGPFATLLFSNMFKTEGFDKNLSSWETPVLGPMNGANQALSYIVFKRDIEIFKNKYPNLDIVRIETCPNYLMYLFSGGLNFRQLIPNWAVPLLKVLQKVLSPFDRWFALHHVIVIQKKY